MSISVSAGVTKGVHVSESAPSPTGTIITNEHVFVDFLDITVLLQETAQDTRATHPQDGLRQAGISGAVSFASACVSAFPLGDKAAANTGTGVNDSRLPDDKTILDELADIEACQ